MALTIKQEKRNHSFVSSDSTGSSDSTVSSGSKDGKMISLNTSINDDLFSADSLCSRISTSRQSDVSGYVSDVSCSSGLAIPSWSDFQRKRSPSTKTFLCDLKDKLLDEVKNVDLELNAIEIETRALINVRAFLINLRNKLCESERNNLGLLVPEKLKGMIEKTAIDVCGYEDILGIATGIPHGDEVKSHLHKVKVKTSTLSQSQLARIKIEDIEDLFGRCGKLFGVVDAVMLIYYEKEYEAKFCRLSLKNGHDEVDKAVFSENITDSKICGRCQGHVSSNGDKSPAGSGLYDMEKRDGNDYFPKDDKPKKRRSICDIVDQRSTLQAMVKEITKIKKQLKSVERMTSGRPKMKNLVTKFHEVLAVFKIEHLKQLELYTCVLDDNVRKFQEVLKTEKPAQCDLDNAWFLLSELSGRAAILLKQDTAVMKAYN